MALHRKAGHFYTCQHCDFQSPLYRVMRFHYYRKHKVGETFSCSYCSLIFNQRSKLQDHILTQHVSEDLPMSESAFKKSCVSYGTRFKETNNPPLSIDQLFSKYSPQLKAILQSGMQTYTSFKASVIVFAKLSKYDYSTGIPIESCEFIHQSKAHPITSLTSNSELDDLISRIESDAEEKFSGYCDLEGSGWTFEHVSGLFLQMGSCSSLTGGCYQKSEFKSDFIWDGNSNDGECFYMSVSRHFFTEEEEDASDEVIRAHAMESFEECRNGVRMSTNSIPKFEKKYNLSINVIAKEGSELYVVYNSGKESDNPINLLLIQLENSQYHYAYILDVCGLINELGYASSVLSISDSASRRALYPCLNCLNVFSSKQVLTNHEKDCKKYPSQRVVMPLEGQTLGFSRYESRYKAPLIGAFDFESKMTKDNLESTLNSRDLSTHKIVSYSFMLISSKNEIVFERSEMDENDCLSLFMEALMDASSQIDQIFDRIIPMNLSDDEEETFQSTIDCHICGFEVDKTEKVRDHCHFTGKFIGAAHKACNLKRRREYRIPVYAHNFSGYDSHFLLQAIVAHNQQKYIPNLKAMCFNSQKFRSISFDIFNFLDSMQFINDSLDSISSQLFQSKWKYEILEKSGIYSTQKQKELLLKKGVFPYELLTSLKKFKDLRAFPDKELFYSNLSEKTISDELYNHGKTVFEEFKCSNMAQYLMLYNKLDVILLLEAMTSFRDLGWREFGLDPAYFISLPQYGFQW